jgi:hypothetical protein
VLAHHDDSGEELYVEVDGANVVMRWVNLLGDPENSGMWVSFPDEARSIAEALLSAADTAEAADPETGEQ